MNDTVIKAILSINSNEEVSYRGNAFNTFQ